ncbi:hypothetical protein AB0878_46995 [Amycolatopsis sp. NPDC047767]|uniref:hypothetical protein n=1 Tax=Amycolatopsis sp. NPDC047767 TaxID=3156765 RepID=UPI0034555591
MAVDVLPEAHADQLGGCVADESRDHGIEVALAREPQAAQRGEQTFMESVTAPALLVDSGPFRI